MNPTACFREPWADVRSQKAEKPQYYQNDDDRPQHEISPYKWLISSSLVRQKIKKFGFGFLSIFLSPCHRSG
jgi:hypothetical protein